MNVTLTLEDDLVTKATKIAAERDTTLNGMVRDYLQTLTADEEAEKRKKDLERLHQSFRDVQVNIDKITWKRQDLYERF
ncbi:MAG TPA: DUF6364 family protein [Bryobacteraceae bacterium]|nr:DUF6364 family protein [Bryobacteraceae bacterium]